jgi:ApbE superfamily uncharacterized protein (UPF0280 family)
MTLDDFTGHTHVAHLRPEVQSVAMLLCVAAGMIGTDIPLVYADMANTLAHDLGLADTLCHAIRALAAPDINVD